MMDPDFRALFEDLCENSLLRPVDEHLLKSKQNQYVSQMKRDIFFSSLKESVNKYELYKLLSQFKGKAFKH